MCETAHPENPRPSWASLYAVAVVSVGLVGIAQSVTAVVWRAALSVVILLAATVASFAWVYGNRVALDRQEWCACARTSIRVRVVGAHAAAVRDEGPEHGDRVPAPDRSATLVA